jgi:hypothetical protein
LRIHQEPDLSDSALGNVLTRIAEPAGELPEVPVSRAVLLLDHLVRYG